MKKQIIFTTIFSILSLIKIHSQQTIDITNIESCINHECNNKYYKDIYNNYGNFIGTWVNSTGNMTFEVVIFKKEMMPYVLAVNSYRDEISLKYKMIKDKGLSTETIIYRSDKNLTGTNKPWPDIFSSPSNSLTTFSGLIIDNCAPTTVNYPYLMGRLRFELNTSTNPVTAHWTVRRFSGLHLSDEPDFTIPKEIILTKQ